MFWACFWEAHGSNFGRDTTISGDFLGFILFLSDCRHGTLRTATMFLQHSFKFIIPYRIFMRRFIA
jgi:hypothetical protein